MSCFAVIDMCADNYAHIRDDIQRVVILLTFLPALIRCLQMGNTALLYAARQGHIEVVELLLKHGASVNLQNTVGVGFVARISCWH